MSIPRFFLALLIPVAGLASAVATLMPPEAGGGGGAAAIPAREIAACRAAPTPRCLADLAFAFAMQDETPPAYSAAAPIFAVLGEIERAHALLVRSARFHGVAPDDAARAADDRLASHRIVAAIRAGASVEEAIAATPAVRAGSLWIAASDLLGTNPHGVARVRAKPRDAATSAVVHSLAANIETLAEGEQDRPRSSHLLYAAELYAALDDADGARGILAKLRPNEVLGFFSVRLDRVIGPDEGLRIQLAMRDAHPGMYLDAAAAEDDAANAGRYLREAFRLDVEQSLWPRFSGLLRVVEASVHLGHPELARELAERVADLADSNPNPEKVFGNIYAARALHAAEAPEAMVRARLARAESLFPDNPSKIVAFGLIGGAYRWGNSGLDAEARSDIARLSAVLGDIPTVERMMTGIEQPYVSWQNAISPDIAPENLGPIFDLAARVLTPGQLARLRASHAAWTICFGLHDARRDWAEMTVRGLATQDLGAGADVVSALWAVSDAATNMGDRNFERGAHLAFARAALDAADPRNLATAALRLKAYEAAAPE